jgi:hypothetical protein
MTYHNQTLHECRQYAAGWHFAREALSTSERQMLTVVEELLNEIDCLYGKYAPVWPSEILNASKPT